MRESTVDKYYNIVLKFKGYKYNHNGGIRQGARSVHNYLPYAIASIHPLFSSLSRFVGDSRVVIAHARDINSICAPAPIVGKALASPILSIRTQLLL